MHGASKQYRHRSASATAACFVSDAAMSPNRASRTGTATAGTVKPGTTAGGTASATLMR